VEVSFFTGWGPLVLFSRVLLFSEGGTCGFRLCFGYLSFFFVFLSSLLALLTYEDRIGQEFPELFCVISRRGDLAFLFLMVFSLLRECDSRMDLDRQRMIRGASVRFAFFCESGGLLVYVFLDPAIVSLPPLGIAPSRTQRVGDNVGVLFFRRRGPMKPVKECMSAQSYELDLFPYFFFFSLLTLRQWGSEVGLPPGHRFDSLPFPLRPFRRLGT